MEKKTDQTDLNCNLRRWNEGRKKKMREKEERGVNKNMRATERERGKTFI